MSTPSSVFVTGAAGFIGRALVERYRALGARVRGVDAAASADPEIVHGDVATAGAWQDHAEGCELFIHTAAIVSYALDFERFWQVNVLGTRRALDAAVAGGARRFVHFSSITAFSFDFPDGVDERWPVRTNGVPYVDTKVTSEAVVLAAHSSREMVCTIVRPGDVYGPGSPAWTVLPVQLIRKNLFLLPAMGKGLMSPIYIDNLIDGVVAAAAAPEGAGEIFTLTDGIGVPTAEFFGHYAVLLGRGPLRTLPTALALPLVLLVGRVDALRGIQREAGAASIQYLSRKGTYSIEKARTRLGYAPKVDLEEGMRRTCAWLRESGSV